MSICDRCKNMWEARCLPSDPREVCCLRLLALTHGDPRTVMIVTAAARTRTDRGLADSEEYFEQKLLQYLRVINVLG
jgi:hypothetical protein